MKHLRRGDRTYVNDLIAEIARIVSWPVGSDGINKLPTTSKNGRSGGSDVDRNFACAA